MVVRRPSLVETVVLLALAMAFVIVMAWGDSNGIGVFQQPDNDLLAPLLVGLVVNGFLFFATAFVLLPSLLRDRRGGRFTAALLALGLAVLAGKTMAHWLLIRAVEPSLLHVGWGTLLAENAKSFIVFLVVGTLYGLSREAVRPQPPAAPVATAGTDADYIDFWSGKTLHRLPSEEILYLEGKGNYVKVVGRQRSVMVYTTLRDQEARLCAGPDFARIHRSYIVALRNLASVEGSSVTVGERRLPVSAGYSRPFLEKLRGRDEGSS